MHGHGALVAFWWTKFCIIGIFPIIKWVSHVHQHMPTSCVGWIDDVTKSASGPVFSCSWYKKTAPIFAFSPAASNGWLLVTSPGGLVV